MNLDVEFDHDDDRRWAETPSHPDAEVGCSIEGGQKAGSNKLWTGSRDGRMGDVVNFEKGEVVRGGWSGAC